MISDVFDQKDARRKKLNNKNKKNRSKNSKNIYDDINEHKFSIKPKKIKKFRENNNYEDDFFGKKSEVELND